ncbi:Ubiquitin-like domain-containing CTD phosphatase 1 [Seminavis robusta]|uniref:Ubiquitin-like domain-containing CTD phosphatase 1 n=1 Tax=Seminavis robusta TaxID=568900 RepID=A0A9N8GZZ1_9STRA|nr:Ubiquitin-like domain-containing CTD phosphatase 1 [Seminavis robusta]|eukprot:Sro11_g008730.1 Ubiquitin-like domain-containing CTD phosphatase 1 (386) ;mRNA; f:137353-138674
MNDDTTTTTPAPTPAFTLIAKWAKERIELSSLTPETSIGAVKEMLKERTGVLPKRQKLIGLTVAKTPGGPSSLTDQVVLQELKVKKPKGKTNGLPMDNTTNNIVLEFILMGSKEEEIFVDPQDKDDLPDVIDDFDLDFNAGSDQWLRHVANGENLKKFTEKTVVHIMNEPRPNKPLLVLDLDHTLLDFSSRVLQRDATASRATVANAMKRPYMDQFLTAVYQHYDLVVWSQTSWRWLETKLIELGMLANPGYKFCFVLDKTSMFTVTSTRRDGSSVTHHVKPLQLIWSKFADRWSSSNTAHVDDLGRNFALNLGSGIKISAYYRKKSSARRDAELLGLSRYLEELACAGVDFDTVDFSKWQEVVSAKRNLTDGNNNNNNGNGNKK